MLDFVKKKIHKYRYLNMLLLYHVMYCCTFTSNYTVEYVPCFSVRHGCKVCVCFFPLSKFLQ